MTRFLIFLFPALMDAVVAGTFFVNENRLADMGASATAVGAVISIWAVLYVLICQVVGRFLNERNAATLLIVAALAVIVLAGGFILFDSQLGIYALMLGMAVCTALFFVPFQIFMKAVEKGRPAGLVRSTALYTFSWSMGFAVGPFVTGYLWTLADGVGGLAGWQWCYVFMAALGAVTAAGIWFLKHHAQPHHSDETTGVPKTPIDEYAGLPDLVKVSWFCAGAGIVALHLVVGVFPKSAEVYGVPVADRGLTLFLLYTMQALVGLSFIRSRMWMYRAVPLLAAGAFGVAGLVLFGSARTASLFIVAGLCYGVYSGMFYFYFVFHAIVHPSRAPRYVAVNESVVGLSGLIGPMVGGQLADRLTLSTPYYTAAAVIAAVVLLQGLIHARHRPAVNRWTRGRD